MALSSSLRRASGALLITAALVVSGATLEPTSAAPSNHAAKQVAHKGKKPKQKLTLQMTSPAPIINGATVSFSGTAPGSLNGKQLKLFRRVGAGDWVTVGKAKISGRAFSVAGLATGAEANSWYVSAKLKKGRKHHKRKKVFISGVVTNSMYSWYPLTEDNSVEDTSFYQDRVDIGSETFLNALYAYDSYDYSTFSGEWNLSYKCLQITGAYGITNASSTGTTATFSVAADGVATTLETKGLGPASRFTLDVATRLRVKLSTSTLSGGTSYDDDKYPAFAGVQVLCSSNPF